MTLQLGAEGDRILNYCREDAIQSWMLYEYYQWQKLLEEFYYAHGNGD